MFVLKISMMLIGILFIFFGYLIFFKSKYYLINNFIEDKNRKKLDDNYAKKVGFIEFTGGLVTLTLGVLSLFLSDTITFVVFSISVLSIIIALVVIFLNSVSKKNESP